MSISRDTKDAGLPLGTLGAVGTLSLALIGTVGFVKYRQDVSLAELAVPEDFRLWSLALTLMAWSGFVIAAFLAAALVIGLRRKHENALKALTRSIENLTKGDLNAPIWGLERTDSIGGLARALDLARYHFSQLPDLSLMSEQGPVRLRFEGETRSLFEAMMRNMTEDYERARKEISGTTRELASQQDLLTTFTARLNMALNQLQQHGVRSDQALQQVTQSLTDSARALLAGQEKTTAKLEQTVPWLQDRARSMAEVTQIAGTQVAETIKALLQAAQAMRADAAQSREMLQQMAVTANQMGERLFAAVNLTQASGKMLTETTETVRNRLNEAVETLARNESGMQRILTETEERLSQAAGISDNAERLASVTQAVTACQAQLSEQTAQATQQVESLLTRLDDAQRAVEDAAARLAQDGEDVGHVLRDLRATSTQQGEAGAAAVQQLTEQAQALLQKLEAQITQQGQSAETRLATLTTHSETLALQAQTVTAALAQTVATLRSEHDTFMETRTAFAATLDQIGDRLERKAADAFGKADAWENQNAEKLAALAEHIDSVMQRLNLLGQLTGTLGSVAGQLGQLMPALTAQAGSSGGTGEALSEAALTGLQEQWQQTGEQLEVMRRDLTQLITRQKDQLDKRLTALDKKLQNAPSASGGVDPQQTAIISDIVMTLSKINEHVMQLEESVHGVALREA